MNLLKIKEIGTLLKYFYQLHTDKTFDEVILYSIGFNGYIDCIEGLQENILEGKINYASFINKKSKKSNKSVFKNNYYACLKNESPIKNTIHFNNNLIITGPNASGKTTILKSVLINIIFTQQFGCAFYDSAKFNPFDHIHCYLNIPDTSGRDSLFQAEARRCKEIIDYINNNKTDTHFCAFDEIYSGTNPEEAENSASSFMLYLQKYKKVFSILTTHFINVCKKLENIDGIINCKMKTIKQNNLLKYMYKLEPGISDVKGGINVLTEMNYPKEIIDNIL
jgi:DNA mismatch repair ATPase MutS